MTSTFERARTKGAAPQLAAGLPQVNLLPAEIYARRALGRTKKLLAVVLAAVLGFVVLLYLGSLTQLAVANVHRDNALAETARLNEEQKQYAEVPQVLGKLDRLDQARVQGFSTEVLWKPYLDAIEAVLPAGVELSAIELAGATPMQAPAPAMDPLQAPSVARLNFTGRSAAFIDTAGWIDALNSIPGFSDAWVSNVSISADGNNEPYYEVVSSVQVSEAAYAERFVEGEN